MQVHQLADVHPDAQIAENVVVGPFSVVGPQVKIGPGTHVMNNVTITGDTTIGEGNVIFPSTVLGATPQDLKYAGGETRLEIGDRNTIRECVTINLGTEFGGWVTKLGSDNLVMACAHIAHDCIVGDHVIMANCTLVAGHCHVEDYAKIMGIVGIHQFATIGRHAAVGGMSRVVQDVPPFMMVAGETARVHHVNVIGLHRDGLSDERIAAIRDAHKLLFGPNVTNRSQVLAELDARPDLTDDVRHLVEFMKRTQQGKSGRALEAERSA